MIRLCVSLILTASLGSLFGQNVTFDSPESYFAPSVVYATGDFNKDGKRDIVSAAGSVDLFTGRGDGTFATPVTIATGPSGAVAVSMIVADFNRDGSPDLAIAFNSSPGTVMLLLGNGNGTFKSPVSYPVGNQPVGMVIADFTGDGIPDLITGSAGGGISLLAGNGNGTFQTAADSSSAPVLSIETGDFNGDSKQDLAIVDATTTLVSIYFGNGSGGFTAGPSVTCPVEGVKVADINKDGRADLVVDCFNGYGIAPGPNSLEVYFANSDGTFQNPASTNTNQFGSAAMVVTDLNGDGNLDVVVEDNVRLVFLGNGEGAFTLVTPSNPNVYNAYSRVGVSVAAADLNGDSKMDLIVGTKGSTFFRIQLGNGDGTFRQPGALPVVPGNGTYQFHNLVTGDFNKDGKQDFAAIVTGTAYSTCAVAVWLGNGDRTFQSGIYTLVGDIGGGAPCSLNLLAADLNGDQIPDLITTGGNDVAQVTVLLGNGDGTFQAPVVTTLPSPIYQTDVHAAADFTGDSKTDLALLVLVSGHTQNALVILPGNGDGTFKSPIVVTGAVDGAISITAADVNDDGKPDLVAANEPPDLNYPFISVIVNKGGGTFQTTYTPLPSNWRITGASVADLNGDSKADVVVAGYESLTTGPTQQGFSVLLSNGDGTLRTSAQYSAGALFPGTGITAPIIADFNGDNRMDIVTTNGSDLLVWQGNGDGTFTAGNIFVNTSTPVAADFTGTNRPDLLSSNFLEFFLLANTTPVRSQ